MLAPKMQCERCKMRNFLESVVYLSYCRTMEIQHGRLSGGGPAPSIDINILKAESTMTKKLIIIS